MRSSTRRLSGQKMIAGGQDGSVYALDMLTGCVHWTTTVQSQVRSWQYGGEAGGNPAVFFGDSAGSVYALDAIVSGKQLWKARAVEHPASTVTATPVYHKDRLYVGLASREEAMAVSLLATCAAPSGAASRLWMPGPERSLWKTYMIGTVAKARSKPDLGAAGWGPSGVGVRLRPCSTPNETSCT